MGSHTSGDLFLFVPCAWPCRCPCSVHIFNLHRVHAPLPLHFSTSMITTLCPSEFSFSIPSSHASLDHTFSPKKVLCFALTALCSHLTFYTSSLITSPSAPRDDTRHAFQFNFNQSAIALLVHIPLHFVFASHLNCIVPHSITQIL